MNGWLVRHVERDERTKMRMTVFLEPMFSGDQSLSQVVGWLQVRTLLKTEV